MAMLERINIKISKLLSDKKYTYLLPSLFLLVIFMLTFMMTKNTIITTPWFEYTFFYTWISYFFIITGVLYLNIKILVPRFLVPGKLKHYILSIAGSVLLVMVLVVITQNLFFDITDTDKIESPLINLIGNLLSIGMLIVSTSVYALFRGWAEYSRQVSELESSTKEAELQQLKNQVNPHFLFNTINNINIKVEKEPQLAYNMITKLEDLLRYQLKDTNSEKVYLKNDISFFSDYLELEKTRRNRFTYTIEASNDVYDLEVYPLLFIPFVENAVKHSLSASGEAIVHIVFKKVEDRLYFFCKNTKPSTPVSLKKKIGGIGLINIKRRLELLYLNTYILKITESDDNYTVDLWIKI